MVLALKSGNTRTTTNHYQGAERRHLNEHRENNKPAPVGSPHFRSPFPVFNSGEYLKNKIVFKAPVLVRIGRKIIPSGIELFEFWKFRVGGEIESDISIIEPINSLKSGLKWLMTSEGELIKFVEISRKPRTPLFLKKIVNFTRVYYDRA